MNQEIRTISKIDELNFEEIVTNIIQIRIDGDDLTSGSWASSAPRRGCPRHCRPLPAREPLCRAATSRDSVARPGLPPRPSGADHGKVSQPTGRARSPHGTCILPGRRLGKDVLTTLPCRATEPPASADPSSCLPAVCHQPASPPFDPACKLRIPGSRREQRARRSAKSRVAA